VWSMCGSPVLGLGRSLGTRILRAPGRVEISRGDPVGLRSRKGKVLGRDVLFYGRWLAGHERSHLRQIERIVNTMQT